MSTKGVFTWENSHRRESHTGMTFLFRIAFTWWLGHFRSRYLKIHLMLIKYTCNSKSQALRMRYLFQSTGRRISHRNGRSFRVYMIPLRDFVPEWNLAPVQEPEWTQPGWLEPAWHFVVVSCKQIQSHEREPQWTRSGTKVAPVSCKQPLIHFQRLQRRSLKVPVDWCTCVLDTIC